MIGFVIGWYFFIQVFFFFYTGIVVISIKLSSGRRVRADFVIP